MPKYGPLQKDRKEIFRKAGIQNLLTVRRKIIRTGQSCEVNGCNKDIKKGT
jgi:hypothetical protein